MSSRILSKNYDVVSLTDTRSDIAKFCHWPTKPYFNKQMLHTNPDNFEPIDNL